jgi:uncharacterized cofD-like protein
LSFDPEQPRVPRPVVDAITEADWVLLGPGSLFTSVLAVCALPAVTSALARTPAHVLWISNLEPQFPETDGMSAADHLIALRGHGVRVDTVLYDPRAELHLSRRELASANLRGLSYPLLGWQRGRHDPVLLSAALSDLFADGQPTHRPRRSPSERFSAHEPHGA